MAKPREEVIARVAGCEVRAAVVRSSQANGGRAVEVELLEATGAYKAGDLVALGSGDWRPIMHGDQGKTASTPGGCDWCGTQHCKLCGASFVGAQQVARSPLDRGLCTATHCAALARRFPAVRCSCGGHGLPERAENDPPGMARTLCVDGVLHTAAKCERYEAAGSPPTQAVVARFLAERESLPDMRAGYPEPQRRGIKAMVDDEAFAALLEAGPRWCRARLLRALGQAAAQGVLDEAIHELLDEPMASYPTAADEVLLLLVSSLLATGWLPPGARKVT